MERFVGFGTETGSIYRVLGIDDADELVDYFAERVVIDEPVVVMEWNAAMAKHRTYAPCTENVVWPHPVTSLVVSTPYDPDSMDYYETLMESPGDACT